MRSEIRIVPVVRGDGVGPEVTGSMMRVIDAAMSVAYGNSKCIVWQEVLAGGAAYEKILAG